MYGITDYTYKKAYKLGVQIKPSTNKHKKIDVFKNNTKIASIGATGYMDYPHYLLIDPILAKEKRKNYKKRHAKDRVVVGTNGYYADQLLW